jgi:hypothetical protein
VETPAESPFRQKDSFESRERQQWIESLPISKNSQTITTHNNKTYNLTIVDILPTVQEFCTPAPGGQKICSVNSYIFNQLWFPVFLFICSGVSLGIVAIYWFSLRRPWRLRIDMGEEYGSETRQLKNGERLYLGGDRGRPRPIELPGGDESRGYLERKGNKLILTITRQGTLSYNNKTSNSFRIDTTNGFTIKLPDYEDNSLKLSITVKK